ncbi:hypothetical protein I551_1565 [Mycobacterium ulcerans str. Harvey]|uniref:Uncharacterized protein n=1 Tax=Mycobacterium ulcerans str. Harvey TaxID=1299332 RepID=A0ABN0R4I0_MYCUL|nr:hypothetical protein I551_1565 [Mycobacterium ulcerans str. Harvey]
MLRQLDRGMHSRLPADFIGMSRLWVWLSGQGAATVRSTMAASCRNSASGW